MKPDRQRADFSNLGLAMAAAGHDHRVIHTVTTEYCWEELLLLSGPPAYRLGRAGQPRASSIGTKTASRPVMRPPARV